MAEQPLSQASPSQTQMTLPEAGYNPETPCPARSPEKAGEAPGPGPAVAPHCRAQHGEAWGGPSPAAAALTTGPAATAAATAAALRRAARAMPGGQAQPALLGDGRRRRAGRGALSRHH